MGRGRGCILRGWRVGSRQRSICRSRGVLGMSMKSTFGGMIRKMPIRGLPLEGCTTINNMVWIMQWAICYEN